MTGDEVRQVFEAMLPQEEIDRLCQQCGVIERQRKLNLGMFVRAMVISAGTPGGAYQADVLRSYLEFEVPRCAVCLLSVVRRTPGTFHGSAGRASPGLRPGTTGRSGGPTLGVTDWYIVDATTVTVREALREEYPGTGGYGDQGT